MVWQNNGHRPVGPTPQIAPPPRLPDPAITWYNRAHEQGRDPTGFLQAFRLFVATRIVFWVVIGPILIVLQLAQSTPAWRWTYPA